MYLLPAIQIEEAEIRLPCPALHLLQLAAQICRPVSGELLSGVGRERMLHQDDGTEWPLLWESPSLLIFALARCRNDVDRPETTDSLWQWSRQNLLPMLTEVVSQSEVKEFSEWEDRRHVIALCHRRFLLKPSRKRLIRFIREVAACQGVLFSKRICKDWLSQSGIACFELPCLKESESQKMIRLDSLIESAYYQSPSAFGFETTWEVAQGYHELNRKFNERLRLEKLKSLKQLAYGASHEVNNPLANIATRAETLIRNESDPEKRRLLSVVHAQSMRAHDMIADMMLFANPPKMEVETRDLSKLTRQLVGELREELRDSRIEVLLRSYPDVRAVPVDPTHFSVAMKALICNSIDAIGCDGQIRVRFFRESENWIGISVLDTGPGVRPEQAAHLFDPFYSGREAGRGLGFGLSKAWRIIHGHGGNIYCDESCQTGGKFEIRLPVTHKFSRRIDIARAA